MKNWNHFSLSFVVCLWIYYYIFNFEMILTFSLSFLTAFLSFLPDIDLKIIFKIDQFNRDTFFVFFPITFLLKLIFKHRGITHSLWIPMVLFFIGEFLLNDIFSLVFRVVYLALFLHIIEDSFTISGVEIFYPFSFNFKVFNLNTSSFSHFWFLEFFAYLIGFLFVFINI